jgi:hypothetical protein
MVFPDLEEATAAVPSTFSVGWMWLDAPNALAKG